VNGYTETESAYVIAAYQAQLHGYLRIRVSLSGLADIADESCVLMLENSTHHMLGLYFSYFKFIDVFLNGAVG
jgi:hypothetical protein